MNKNILIVFGGAVLVAVMVAILVQVSFGGKKKEPVKVVQEAKVEILMAAKNLSIGHELKDGDLRWQEWPKTGVFPVSITRKDKQKPSQVAEGRLARNLSEGEPLTMASLLGQAKGNFVAASLEPGMRALAIEVSASSMVAGFIGPGDFVDIMLTYKEDIESDSDNPNVQKYLEKNLEKYATETILQNVKILAVDQTATRPKEEEKIKVGKTVTVAVNAQDAERLALAAQLGDINLVLRGVGDDVIVEKKWPTISDARLTSMDDEIYQGYDEIEKDAGINPNIMRIYRGGDILAIPTK